MGDAKTKEEQREAQWRWGETNAYAESRSRMERYTEADKALMEDDLAAILDAMVAQMAAGEDAESDGARAVAERHRRHIEHWFYQCDHWMHAELAQMYIHDDRFKSFFEERSAGLATYFSAAVTANTLVEAGELRLDSALSRSKTAMGVGAAKSAGPFAEAITKKDDEADEQKVLEPAAAARRDRQTRS